MIALLLLFLACSSQEEAPIPAVVNTLPSDNVRNAGEITTSTYILFAVGPHDHLIPLACFDTVEKNSRGGAVCLDHMGLDTKIQLDNGQTIEVEKATTIQCRSSEESTTAMKSTQPIGSGVRFGVWPNLAAANWTPRAEDTVRPNHLRPIMTRAQLDMKAGGLPDSLIGAIEFRSVLNLDIDGDGTEDSLVEAFVTASESDQVLMSRLYIGGLSPQAIQPSNLAFLSEMTEHRVLGAAETTSKGAWMVFLESTSATHRGWSVIQSRGSAGDYIGRGSWNCDRKD